MLAEALLAQGWSVWWDWQIPAGKTFDHVIAEALASARCVVVLWSGESINSNWVREEAEEGRKRGILIPVLIDNVIPPFGFGRIHAADLINWDGAKTSEAFRKLAIDIAAIVGPPPITTEKQGTSTIEEPPRQAVEEDKHQLRTAPKAILLLISLYKRKLKGSLTLALFAVLIILSLYWLGFFKAKPSVVNHGPVQSQIVPISTNRQPESVKEKPVLQAPTQPSPTLAPASESGLKLTAIPAEGSDPLTRDLYYEIYEAKKDLEGVRKRVDYSRDAAPLFKLPAGRYYVTVTHGNAYASTEVEVAAGQETQQTLNLKAGYLQLSSILAQYKEPLERDLYYEIYEAKKDFQGKRKRVDYSRDAAPLFKLPAERYYVTVIYGDASASTEVEIAAGERHELKLEIKMP
jgi:hypothetical protein